MGGRTLTDERLNGGTAGRAAAVLYVVSGLVTLSTPLLPRQPGFNVTGVVIVGILGVAGGGIAFVLPWRRWPRRSTLVLLLPAFGLIVAHNVFAGVDPYRYGLFFLVAFCWVGTFHPRGTALATGPLVLVAYLVPLLVHHESGVALSSVAYAVPLDILVGETLAWQAQRLATLERRLRHQAYHDALTGLANRALFLDQLERAVVGADGRPATVAVAFLDLDGFKTVNDTYGHQAGDELLVAVGEALTDGTRRGELAARYGGDEFAVLLGRDADPAACHALVARLSEEIESRVRADPRWAGITASTGVVVASTGDSPEQVITAVDTAMYEAKAQGGGRCVVLDHTRAVTAAGHDGHRAPEPPAVPGRAAAPPRPAPSRATA